MTPRYAAQVDKPHKYRAVRTTVDGVTFASKAEARRYAELKLLEKAGEIHGLTLQPGFPLVAQSPLESLPTKLGDYRADFLYCRCKKRGGGGKHTWVVEDVKGFMTPLSRWKIKHCEAQYGIKVEIVK
jgi:hypothetical protein